MSEKASVKKRLLLYTDGSVRPNPGFGGFGIYGFSYFVSDKPKNTKHPFKNTLYFSEGGVGKERQGPNITVETIIETVRAFKSKLATNNEIELSAVLCALEKASVFEDLEKLIIFTDSNYIVKCFNEELDGWPSINWKRKDGKTISHLNEWTTIASYKQQLKAKGVEIVVNWVKGHSDDYGNIMADLLANIGSNAARVQLELSDLKFTPDILDATYTYAEYKQMYTNRDFMYYFKDMMFGSTDSNDINYCFLCNTEDDREKGKRNNSSIFLANIGYVPELVTRIKSFYRSIPRNFVATCTAKLSKFENRDVLRLSHLVDIQYMLRPVSSTRSHQYSLVGTEGTFLEENIVEFPFIANITRLISFMQEFPETVSDCICVDVTNRFVQDGKLLLTNKDKFVEFGDLVTEKIVFTQRLLGAIGYDFPSYLALKGIEEKIKKVDMILHQTPFSDYFTLYVRIQTDDRDIYSVNIPNKFLGKRIVSV